MHILFTYPQIFVLMLLFMSNSLTDSLCSVLLTRIQTDLNMSVSANEALTPLGFFGLSFGMLFWGYMADRMGRKRMWITGCLLSMLSFIGCAYAPHTTAFLFFRWLQGCAGSVTSVMSLVVIRDLFEAAADRSQAHAVVNQSFALGPILAYLLTTLPMEQADWRSLYLLLAALQFPILYFMRNLRLKQHQATPLALGDLQWILTQPGFMRSALTAGLAIAVSLCYLSLMPQLMSTAFHAESYYPYTLIFLGCVWWASCPLAWRIHASTRAPQGILFGARLLGLTSLLACLMYSLPYPKLSLVGYLGFLISSMLGTGVIIPEAIGLALHAFPRLTGLASALLGCLYYGIASGLCMIATQFPNHPLILPVIFIFFSILIQKLYPNTPASSTEAVDNTVENFRTAKKITHTQRS